MKRHLQCAEQQVSRSNLTKYCACHAERLTYLVLITYETSFTVRGATGVTIQPHQILRLPRKMTRLLYRPHIWNVISNARSNRCHYPTSPNIAPATKNDTARFQRKSPKTGETSFPMRGRSEHDPTMIREWKRKPNPPRKWGYFSRSPEAFSIVKYNVLRPILHSNLHQVLHLPRKITLELHQVLHLPRKVTLELHQILRLPRKVTLELHQILRLPRKVTLELFWHNLWKQVKRHFQCGDDPSMIREWKRKPQPASQVRLLFEVPRSIFYCKIQRFAPNLTFKPSPSAAPATKSDTWTSPNTAPTTKNNTWTSPSTAPATKSDTWTSPNTAPTTKK